MFVSLTVPLLSQNYPASCCDLEGNCYKDTKNPRSRKLDKPKLVSLFSFYFSGIFVHYKLSGGQFGNLNVYQDKKLT